jgi:hypothetical protein
MKPTFAALLVVLGTASCLQATAPAADTPGGGGAGSAGNAAGSGGNMGSAGGGAGGAGGGSGAPGNAGSGGGGGTGGGASMPTPPKYDGGLAPDRASGDRSAPGRDAGASDSAAAVPPEGFGAGPLTECSPGPSLGRLQLWRAHGNTVPGPQSNLLVKEGDRHVATVRFTAPAPPSWSEAVLYLTNVAEAARDLRTSSGFTITYSATADLWIQLRGTVKRDGGDQHVAALPATGGAVSKRSIRFAPEDWTFLSRLGKPNHAFADAVRTAVLFNFVGQTNEVTVHDLRFDNYVPACP